MAFSELQPQLIEANKRFTEVAWTLLVTRRENGRIGILVADRQDGTSTYPGGKREGSEKFVEAALREIKEESGLDYSKLYFAGVHWYCLGQQDYESVAYVSVLNGKPQQTLPNKHGPWRVVSLSGILALVNKNKLPPVAANQAILEIAALAAFGHYFPEMNKKPHEFPVSFMEEDWEIGWQARFEDFMKEFLR